jgi:hypothetical protein
MFALGVVSSVDYRMTGEPQFVSSSGVPSQVYQLSSPSGPVTNIYPYASDGTTLKGVLLYDQDGRPLRTEMQLWWADRCERAVSYPRAADGVGVEHSYPKTYLLTGANGALSCNTDGYTPQVPIPTFPATAEDPSGTAPPAPPVPPAPAVPPAPPVP